VKASLSKGGKRHGFGRGTETRPIGEKGRKLNIDERGKIVVLMRKNSRDERDGTRAAGGGPPAKSRVGMGRGRNTLGTSNRGKWKFRHEQGKARRGRGS